MRYVRPQTDRERPGTLFLVLGFGLEALVVEIAIFQDGAMMKLQLMPRLPMYEQ